MTWSGIVLPAMAALIAVLLQPADAVSRLCINGDDEINLIFADGVNLTDQLKYGRNVKKCDCVELPPNVGVIAVEARNGKQARGIQACNTDGTTAVYKDWVCRPARDNWFQKGWYDSDFDDSAWKPAKTYKCVEHCRQYYRQPCAIWATKCFWSHKPKPEVRCRFKQCADGCTGCSQTGPGSCDPGKCKLGSGTDELTGKTLCNRRCLLEVKAWGKTGEAADGYVRVTDLVANSVDVWTANVSGDYLATIDMTTCSIQNESYALWSQNDAVNGQKIREWLTSTAGAEFKNVIGIELGVGQTDVPDTTDFTKKSYAPWISIHRFGVDNVDPIYGNGKYHSFSAVLTGVQNGAVAFTDIKLVT